MLFRQVPIAAEQLNWKSSRKSIFFFFFFLKGGMLNIVKNILLLFCWLDEVYSIHGGQWLPSSVYVFYHCREKKEIIKQLGEYSN
jgi:hypothetical protein